MPNFFSRYLETALQLINNYDGSQPLSIYLKTYFSLHKKHGSKDRKWIAHFCYCYYRLGFALRELNNKERLLIAVFLCSETKGDWLSLYEAKWQDAFAETIDSRIRFIQSIHLFRVDDIFYNNEYLEKGIDATVFNKSHLMQPDVFIRIRPHQLQSVIDKLRQQNMSFTQMSNDCLAVENATKINAVIDLNKEAVIQDYSSQQIASFFSLINVPKPLSVWDCCAASGGKSILAYDFFTQLKLTVSDVRASIIHNLQKRFAEAGIQHYQSFVADLSSPRFTSRQQYDLVICDAPCSGSGTWSRTPEQLYFFTEEKLFHYTQLQKKITANAVKGVTQNGCFLYITCSVFAQENEDIVTHIQSITKLTLIKAETIKGYDKKADTMFAALFISA